ncbi:unnamed protein product [Paramecium primaurelia]|uniref:Uncharacterized protein n=1 Tax=Paramecium primaurelia TaxID=5886 RepID=A0A8S1MSK8_PARPR|nr:unnamed protein product [Paramecium primaurelia]
MLRQVLISLCLIGLTTAAVTVDASQHCDCTELNQTDCGLALAWCLWNSSDAECQEYSLTCEDLTSQTLCDAADSCKWNSGACEDWDPSCSDGTTAALCNEIDDCYWNKSNACASFSSCADYATDNCPGDQWCTAQSGTCADYTFVTCSSFTTAATCSGADSKTTRCAWANDNTCKSLGEVSACSDLNNFTTMCNNSGSCVYEGTACRAEKCSDATTEIGCNAIETGDTTYSLCAWSTTSGTCGDAADTSAFTKDNCYQRTYRNYKWSSDNKCVACDDLVDNDDVSNSVILGAFVLLALIA